MAQYQPRGKLKRKFYQMPLVLFAVAVVAVLLFISAFHFYGVYRQTVKNKEEAEVKYNELAAQETVDEDQYKNIDTPEGAETILREKYRVAAPGEGVVVLTDPTTAATTPESAEVSSNVFIRFFERVFAKN